jgi:hypothetical protein
MADFLCLKMRLRINFSTKRGSFGQFLIRIQIQDLDPDPNPGFESGFESGFGSGTAGRIRIRNWIRNFSFGSATLLLNHQFPLSILVFTPEPSIPPLHSSYSCTSINAPTPSYYSFLNHPFSLSILVLLLNRPFPLSNGVNTRMESLYPSIHS